MGRDVGGSRCVTGAELSKCCRAYLVVEDEPGNVLYVGALLGDRAVHDCLQFHGDDRTWFGNQCADFDARSSQGHHFYGDLGGGVVSPGMGGGVEAVARVVTRLVDLDLADFEYIHLDLAVRGGQQS